LTPVEDCNIDVCAQCLPIINRIRDNIWADYESFRDKMSVAYGVAAVKQVDAVKFMDWMVTHWTEEADKIFGTNARDLFEGAKKALKL
jgi:hypothetical protein